MSENFFQSLTDGNIILPDTPLSNFTPENPTPFLPNNTTVYPDYPTVSQPSQHWEVQTNYGLSLIDLNVLSEMVQTLPGFFVEASQVSGVRALWLSRKTYGTPCLCVDRISQDASDYYCPICYGTQWQGGYNAREPITIVFEPRPTIWAPNEQGLSVTSNPVGWTFATSPPIKTGDIIILLNNGIITQTEIVPKFARLQVANVNVENIGTSLVPDGVIIYQNIELQILPITDIVYRIPIGGGMGNIQSTLPSFLILELPNITIPCNLTIYNSLPEFVNKGTSSLTSQITISGPLP